MNVCGEGGDVVGVLDWAHDDSWEFFFSPLFALDSAILVFGCIWFAVGDIGLYVDGVGAVV